MMKAVNKIDKRRMVFSNAQGFGGRLDCCQIKDYDPQNQIENEHKIQVGLKPENSSVQFQTATTLSSLKSVFVFLKKPAIQPTSFGEYIKKLRLEKQLSQKDLAKLLNVSAESIVNWEKDRLLPKSAYLERIAHALDFACSKKNALKT